MMVEMFDICAAQQTTWIMSISLVQALGILCTSWGPVCGIQQSDTTEHVGGVVVVNTDAGVLQPRTLDWNVL